LAGNDRKYYNWIFRFLQENYDYSTTLRQVHLGITSDSKCNSAYAFLGGTTDTMICAENMFWFRGACSVIIP
jgi:hypothetical protein